MARKTPPRSLAIIALLEADHRRVEKLVDTFRRTSERKQAHALALTICKELKVHATIEEELFYPALAEGREDPGMVREALVEHSVVKALVARIETMTPDDEYFRETVVVLGEMVEHHVEEEEDEMFDLARRATADMESLAVLMEERKQQLRQELGLPEREGAPIPISELPRVAAISPVSALRQKVAEFVAPH